MNTSNMILTNQVFALVWVFGWAIFFLLVYVIRVWRRQKKLELIHKERMIAMEKGIPLPELPDYETPPRRSVWAESFRSYANSNPRMPLGFGAICIMSGIGTSLALFLSGDPYHRQVWSFGLIGIFFGFGLFLHYFLTKEPTK
jgi:hypothetical protein